MKNRRTKIKFPVFNDYVVHVILANNPMRTSKRLGADGDFCLACVIPGERASWMVLGPDGRDANTISHEAAHIVESLFKWTGFKRDEESFAYHLGYLVERVTKFVEGAK